MLGLTGYQFCQMSECQVYVSYFFFVQQVLKDEQGCLFPDTEKFMHAHGPLSLVTTPECTLIAVVLHRLT
jgi:hypothetical protein